MYRFAKVTTVYGGVAEAFEREVDPSDSYDNLHASFAALRFGWSDFFARHLTALGVCALEIFASLRPLQRAWLREHGMSFAERDWLIETTLAQLREFNPDVVLLEDLYCFDRDARARIRAALPRSVRLVGWRAAPTSDFASFDDLDLMLSFAQTLVQRFRAANIHAAIVPHGFETSVCDEAGSSARDLPFTFAGQLGSHTGPHATRYGLLTQLLESTPIEVWGSESVIPKPGGARALAAKGAYHLQQGLRALRLGEGLRKRIPRLGVAAAWSASPAAASLHERFPQRCHAALFGLPYFQLLARSGIALNSHIDSTGDDAGNMRLYEATGMGACVLTDWKPNLDALFVPGVEVAVYHSADECVEIAHQLMRDDALRRRIALAGQRRTHREHTLLRSVERVHALLLDLLQR